MTERATIVFDLDGTLAETAPDIIGVLNAILVAEGAAPVAVEQARDLVGAGAKVLLERGFALHGRVLGPDELEEFFQRFLQLYADRVADESFLYPGCVAALDALRARGHVLAVCTNKPERHSRLLLAALGIADRFAAIGGRDTYAHHKPDPRHLTLTIAAAGGSAGRAVMVGDSRTDVATARAAGIPVICVPFGYTDVPVEELEPDVVIAHFDQLGAAVEAMLALTPAV